LTNAHGLFVRSNCYTLAGFIFPGGSSRISWAYVITYSFFNLTTYVIVKNLKYIHMPDVVIT